MRVLLLSLLLLGACADPFADAKKIDTIEAWEKYLETKPSGSRLLNAEDRLKDLLVAAAEASNKPEDYDKVLKRFPNARETKKLQEARVKAALAIAEAENTAEAWKKFDAENSFADPGIKKRAKARLEMSAYAPNLAFSEPAVKQVNLAEDPKGPLDGWGFSCNVTNNGDKRIARLNLEVQLLDEKGATLRAFQYPAVAGSYPSGQLADEAFAKPIEPKEVRGWSYTTGDTPEGWSKQVKVVPVSIAFAAE